MTAYFILSCLLVAMSNSMVRNALEAGQSEIKANHLLSLSHKIESLSFFSVKRFKVASEESLDVVDLHINDFIPGERSKRISATKTLRIDLYDEKLQVMEKEDEKLSEVVLVKEDDEWKAREDSKITEWSEISNKHHFFHYGFHDAVKSTERSSIADTFMPIEIELPNESPKGFDEENAGAKIVAQLEVDDIKPVKSEKEVKNLAIETSMTKVDVVNSVKSAGRKVGSESGTDDLVFFEYESVVDEETAIEEAPEVQKGNSANVIIPEVSLNAKENISFPVQSVGTKERKSNSNKGRPVGESAQVSLKVWTPSHGSKKFGKGTVEDYEIRFHDDIDDILMADHEGVVNFSAMLNNGYAVRRGTILAGGYYPVTVDFVLEKGKTALRLPLLNQDQVWKLMENANHVRGGAHILIELDSLTKDAGLDLEAQYEQKIFLDQEMQMVEGRNKASYLMFMGVEPGNHILNFKTYKNVVTSKIIHVGSDEIYFDYNYYVGVDRDRFETFEESLLSQELSMVSVAENQVVELAYDADIKKETINSFEMKNLIYPAGGRKYYEFNHLREPIYIGRWKSNKVVIPSEEYMRFVLNQFQEVSVRNYCMVQINLPKAVKGLSYNGKSESGYMAIRAKVLDKDGHFYEDISHESHRIFLLGEQQGSISVKVSYVDDSYDFVQSFCSQSSYLVEQL